MSWASDNALYIFTTKLYLYSGEQMYVEECKKLLCYPVDFVSYVGASYITLCTALNWYIY